MTPSARSIAGKLSAIAVLAAILANCIPSALPQTPAAPGASHPFEEQDAVAVMDHFRRALEGESRTRVLKLFDSTRMPDYAIFRDQVTQFYEQYQAPTVTYRINQVSQDQALGAIVADFILEALPLTDGLPTLHRRVQLRLVLSWDAKDKEWKIADLAPRSLFR